MISVRACLGACDHLIVDREPRKQFND